MMPARRPMLVSLFLFLLSSLVFAQDLYWEDPLFIVERGARFSQTVVSGDEMMVFWQEAGEVYGEPVVYLSLSVSGDGLSWTENRRFLGPFSFTGEELPFYSADLASNGTVRLAVSEPDNRIHVYESRDGGENFREASATDPLPVRVSPRFFQTSRGDFLLFATQTQVSGVASSLGISYAHSTDALSWSSFKPLSTEPGVRGTFLPRHVSFQGREYVFYQAFNLGIISTFQIYMKRSDDGGRTWGPPIHLSNFADPADGAGNDPFGYDNQRPFPAAAGDRLAMTWERNLAGQQSQVFYAEIDGEGRFILPPERVSRGRDVCLNPRLIFHQNRTYVVWFDNRAGDNHVILARREALFWESFDMTLLIRGNSQFAAFIPFNDDLHLLWENEQDQRSRLVLLVPDHSVTAPVLRGSDFVPSRPVNQDQFTIRWNSPADSSGIAGYSYNWGRIPGETPPRRLMTLDQNRVAEVTVREDGEWYFNLAAQDYAGNWSETTTIPFYRDTTPPRAVTFISPEIDDQGFLPANTGTVRWEPPQDDPFIAGYTWRYQYLAGQTYQGDPEEFNIANPPARILGTEPESPFYNQDNGLWALTVRPYDVAGNLGEASTLFLRMNKYIPVTFITQVRSEEDALGAYTLSLTGRGFSVGGTIERIILDRDRQEPYDIVIDAETGLYQVETDRFINGPLLEDVATADYWVGVVHPVRGLHFSPRPLSLAALGTVKFGDFQRSREGEFTAARSSRYTFSFTLAVVAALAILLGGMALLTARRLVAVVGENRTLERQARALITGQGWTREEQEARFEEIKKMRTGLRFKFALLVTILVLLVVAMVSLPLAYLTNRTQEEILANGLQQRTEVLLESLASGGRAYLPTRNLLELGNLPGQMSAMGQDALFVTVTGEAASGSPEDSGTEWVWATNDPDLLDQGRLSPGGLKLEDNITPRVNELAETLNQEAAARVNEISREILLLNQQVEPLVTEFIRTQNPETEEAINQIQEQLRLLDTTLTARLLEIGNVVFSVPPYDPGSLSRENTEYVFYKPVLFRREGQDRYYRGTVRLGVSTESILQDIQASQGQLFLIIGVVAVIALFLGILGALALATIIIRPIRILVRGVEVIRDAEDIAKELKEHKINTKTRDELSELAETINQMTGSLVDAAKANEMLTMGKDVQKQYIPLDSIPGLNAKGTTIKIDNPDVAIFGYYEGALGVSGDLFDYKQVDQDHIAFIKGDVSGKGVPAALIMVQVATLFTYFFRSWTGRNNERLMQGKPGLAKPNIADLVDQINDLLDFIGAGQAGRFAAFIVGFLNVKTGRCELCHAGDKLLHIYDSSRGMYTREMGERPSAGSFASDLVKMQMGFTTDVQVLKKNDAMILYTDGLEEAERKFRDSDFKPTICREPGLETGELHDTHPVGNPNEELGNERIHEIVNTVFNRGVYHLVKYHNPVENESLTFDFTGCEGTIEEAVIALISVEKVFRIYPHPEAGSQDEIRIDRKIDEFLQGHFKEYGSYFHHPLDKKGVSEEQLKTYNYYTHIREDDQYDDLTIIGIMKK